MLGLGDEYPSKKNKKRIAHAKLVRAEFRKGVLRARDDRIMSGGNRIEPEHGVTFLEALRAVTQHEGVELHAEDRRRGARRARARRARGGVRLGAARRRRARSRPPAPAPPPARGAGTRRSRRARPGGATSRRRRPRRAARRTARRPRAAARPARGAARAAAPGSARSCLRQSSSGSAATRSALIAPLSSPDACGEYTITPMLVLGAEREDLGLDVALQQRVERLQRLDRRDRLRPPHLLDAEVRRADVVDETLLLELGERRPRFLDIRIRDRPVDLVEVDHVQPQPARGWPRPRAGSSPARGCGARCCRRRRAGRPW